jgi:hypothetical protein
VEFGIGSRSRSLPMGKARARSFLLILFLLVLGGCSSSSTLRGTKPHRQGAKVNIPDFINNTAAYKGKSLSLLLKVDEGIDRSKGQSLRDYVGRDVKFMALAPGGQRLSLVITIPAGLSVPEVGKSDEVTVTFVCTRGDLRPGSIRTKAPELGDGTAGPRTAFPPYLNNAWQSSVLRGSFVAGPAPMAMCAFETAGSKIIECRVALP